jgi:polyribonucleotide nucleotidyltransferase
MYDWTNKIRIETSAIEEPESVIEEAIKLAQQSIIPLLDQQLQLRELKPAIDLTLDEIPDAVLRFASEAGYKNAVAMFSHGHQGKQARGEAETAVRSIILNAFNESPDFAGVDLKLRASVVDVVMRKAFRDTILAGKRADGRQMDEVRPIESYPGSLPVVHGSSFFVRGDTHVLVAVTLGERKEAKSVILPDGSGILDKRFYLHYDFPPYCTGELGSASALNRRMVGHGALAEKAVAAIMPRFLLMRKCVGSNNLAASLYRFEKFPYAVRVHSECTSSSGSSSMASVCGASLALMDAGVPVTNAVAGISVGLVTAESISEPADSAFSGQYQLLTDIIGSEDYHGDMDFKIAGTTKGVTAIQLDTKLSNGIPLDIVIEALEKARAGRLHILDQMNKAIAAPRIDIQDSALRAEIVRYDPERKRHLVGPGGEMIRHIETTYDCSVDADEEGVVYIYGKDKGKVAEATELVQDLVVVVAVGNVHMAEVLELKDFGAFVKITRAQEALLHISEISHDPTLLKKPINELLAVGQRIEVKVTF